MSAAYAQTVGSGGTPGTLAQFIPVLFILAIIAFFVLRFLMARANRSNPKPDEFGAPLPDEIRRPVVIRTYKGKQAGATALFQADSARMAAQGYAPTSQVWVPGAYSGKQFLGAVLMCLFLIGFIVFIYMVLVKPDGTLTVTYELRPAEAPALRREFVAEKPCPSCAEPVKAAALKCRFCGYDFQRI